MNQRLNLTPDRAATAMVMTTGSAISPRKALGKPNTDACHEEATVPQLRTALMSQPRSALGFSASVIASTASTNEATRLVMDDTSITIQTPVPVRRVRLTKAVAIIT